MRLDAVRNGPQLAVPGDVVEGGGDVVVLVLEDVVEGQDEPGLARIPGTQPCCTSIRSGGEPERSAVAALAGSPFETVTSILMVTPGLAASNLAASSFARASPQFGVHQTISPATAMPACTAISMAAPAASVAIGFHLFISAPPMFSLVPVGLRRSSPLFVTQPQ